MRDVRAFVRAAAAMGAIFAIVSGGCSNSRTEAGVDGGGDPQGSGADDGGTVPVPTQFEVQLVPDGGNGLQRVNFAIPLPAGALADPGLIAVSGEGGELAAARRALARYPDGTLRSVQIQVDVDVDANARLTVELGRAGAGDLELVPVESMLAGSGNDVRPRVWAIVPSDVLVASGVAGELVPRASISGTALDAWSGVCDYERWNTDDFLAGSASRGVWLYDRVTVMYRGHIVTGELSPLRSAYREAAIYLGGMTIEDGVATAIAVPDAQTDLKYYYSQGMALHYLLTGDDRYREAAEAVSARVVTMWNPVYNGERMWTERHAGFSLLAHEWAEQVTDDQAVEIAARADADVTAYLATQAAQPPGYSDPDVRCFAHSAAAHEETFGYDGCSPWMSAILAEALDTHARRVGGGRAEEVRRSLVELGRSIARDGRDDDGRPYYWMGVGNGQHELDPYEEHWGESAYITALAWNATGRTEPGLREATDQSIMGLREHGVAGQTRSFNWQCRGAVMTPALLQ